MAGMEEHLTISLVGPLPCSGMRHLQVSGALHRCIIMWGEEEEEEEEEEHQHQHQLWGGRKLDLLYGSLQTLGRDGGRRSSKQVCVLLPFLLLLFCKMEVGGDMCNRIGT
jgi:hypothetical protein